MEAETESKNKEQQQQWKNSGSLSSSSRSSSITSDSSDGHFVLKHFPLPKPSISASDAQKQREIYHSGQLMDLPGYDPNRIPSSVFSSKPGNSTTDWSIASNESLFSIHDGNFGNFSLSDHGSRLSEIPKFEEPLHEITENKPVPLPLPPVEKLEPEEKPDSDIDDGVKEIIELESNDEQEDVIEPVVLVKPEEKEVVEEDVINKPEDLISTASHSPSISCRSDTSNNSTCSFAFPVLKEDGITKTPSIEVRGNISHKRRPQYQLPQPPIRPPQPQPHPHSESSTLPQPQPQSQLERKGSKQIEPQTQSPKASKRSFFSCFRCPKPKSCGLFK